ncbi:MAG TPA: dihydrolipoamide acetyltransferase family protein [Longimicrobium sp.]
MAEFRMPSLGADMAAGTLVEWRVHPGDAVRRGDIVAVVDTDKAAIEVEVWESGVVEELLVAEGTRVPVGTVLARLRPAAEGATVPAPAAPAEQPVVPAAAPARARAAAPPPRTPAIPVPLFRPATQAPTPAAPAPAAGRVRASPAARRLAAQRGLDLATIPGTGADGAVVRADVERATPPPPRVSPVAARMAELLEIDLRGVTGTGAGGTITRADVERAAAAPVSAAPPAPPEAPAPPPPEPSAPARDRNAAMRQAVAAAVAKSKREIPHYYLWTHVDASRALAWLETRNAGLAMEERILPAALMLKATALALRAFPELNGFWTDGAFRPGDGIHPGVAVFLRGGGLVAPAILDADRKDLATLMRELRDLVQRARAGGGLRGAEMTSATITVTNLGERGVEGVLGVIYPPQVAIVGIGKIVERPWAQGGMVGVRPVVELTLAADHRASDGHRGSLFLEKIADLLQKPEEL